METLQEIKSKIEKNKEDKLNRLLESAYDLFEEKGFNNTSINDIVKRARVAKGTFYLYFKNKDDIRGQLVNSQSENLFKKALDDLEHTDIDKFEDKLIYIINHVIDQLSQNNEILVFINRDLSLSFYSKEFSKIFSDDAMGLYHLFKKGIQEENIPVENIDITFFMIVELIGTTCYRCMVQKVPCDIETYKPYLFKAIKALIHAS